MKSRLYTMIGLVVAVLFCISLPTLAAVEGEQTTKKLLVSNFSVKGCSPELGTAASVALQNVIANYNSSEYEVVERQILNDLLSSQGLALTGLLRRSTSRRVDADFLLEGDLSFARESFTLSVSLIDAASHISVREHSITAVSVEDLIAQMPQIALIILDLTLAIEAGPLPPVEHVEYNSWYSDNSGIHNGGQIILDISGNSFTGISIESYGRARMSGTIQGNILSGVYEASYGWGNFELEVREGWNRLKGSYYQVSNGANGEWSAVLK